MSRLLSSLVSAWTDFWFTPRQTSSLGLFRIAFGLVVTLWTIFLAPNLLDLFGPEGVMPAYPRNVVRWWGLLAISTSPVAVWALWGVLLIGAVALTVGLFSRVAGWIVFIALMSLENRNPLALNSGDSLLRCLALLCALSPSGASLSLDRLRKAPDRFWEFPERALWGQRLVQILLSTGYLTAVWDKMQGEPWRQGTAVAYALRSLDLQRFPVPAFVTSSSVISEALTFGTLGLEAAIGIFVWNRQMRPWMLILGVSLHVGIDLTLAVGFFSSAMMVAYIAFIPPESAGRNILRLRDKFSGRFSSDAGSQSLLPKSATRPVPTSPPAIPAQVSMENS